MAKSISNSAKRIFGRKSVKTIYTLSISSFIIQDFKKKLLILLCLKVDNFIFWILSVTFAISPVSFRSQSFSCEFLLFHHKKMKQIIELLKCFWRSKVPRSSFLLIIFIIIWNNVYILIGTGDIWCNLFNSFLSSLLSPVYQVCIYLLSRYCQIIIKGSKIFDSDFVVFTKLSKKTLKFFIYFMVIGNAVDRFLSKPTYFWMQLIIFSVDHLSKQSVTNELLFQCWHVALFLSVLAFVNSSDHIFR